MIKLIAGTITLVFGGLWIVGSVWAWHALNFDGFCMGVSGLFGTIICIGGVVKILAET
jgi:hypothetical protein